MEKIKIEKEAIVLDKKEKETLIHVLKLAQNAQMGEPNEISRFTKYMLENLT